MTDLFVFAMAASALLIVPGPTNTLLAASGATIGFSRSVKLIFVELGGYLAAIWFHTMMLGPAVAADPAFATGLKLVASGYLVLCAVRLWLNSGDELANLPPTSASRLFIATMLNPKALIFAFVVFPSPAASDMPPQWVLFAVLVAAIGSGWIALGGTIARSAGQFATPARVSRFAAAVLGIFATVVASSALAGL